MFSIMYRFSDGALEIQVLETSPPDTDIILYIDSKVWNSIVKGRLMQNIVQWSGMHEHRLHLGRYR